MVLNNIRRPTKMQAESFGCSWEIREGVPGAVLVNDEKETLEAYEIAKEMFGEDRRTYPGPTFLGSVEFAFILHEMPGTYCFIGHGDTTLFTQTRYTLNQTNELRCHRY